MSRRRCITLEPHESHMNDQFKPVDALRPPMTVVGVFDDRLLADQAVTELTNAGFGDREIGVVNAACERHFTVIGRASTVMNSEVEAATPESGASKVGLVGLLMGAGVPEHEARYYHDECDAGRTLITVIAGGRSR